MGLSPKAVHCYIPKFSSFNPKSIKCNPFPLFLWYANLKILNLNKVTVELSSLFFLPTLCFSNKVRTTFKNVNIGKIYWNFILGIFFEISFKSVLAIKGSGKNLREFNFKSYIAKNKWCLVFNAGLSFYRKSIFYGNNDRVTQ